MAKAPLLAPTFTASLQLRSQLSPTRHIARRQLQPLFGAKPRRQPRDQPRRAHHDQTRRGPTPTTGPTLVVAMATEGGLQGVVRPRQGRRPRAPRPLQAPAHPPPPRGPPPSSPPPGASAPAVAPAVAAPSSPATPPRS